MMLRWLLRLSLLLWLVAPPRWKPRVFHVPHGVSYAVENSQWGTWLARKLGFRWIDKDTHVTKDGVVVCGHWGLIAKNQFVLPRWFVKKYGKTPRIKDVLWADLQQLRTIRLSWRGTRRYRFVTLKSAMRRAAELRMGIMAEQKGAVPLRKEETWARIDADRQAVGLAKSKLAMASLTTMAGAGAAFAAAHEHIQTIALPRDRVPVSWAKNIDYYKGKWRGWDGTR